MSFPARGETPLGTLRREERLAEGQAIADVFLHPVVSAVTPDVLTEIPRLPDAGCTSIKIFMIGGEFDAQIEGYVRAVALAGTSGLLTLIHCEDHALIETARARLKEEGRTALRYYPDLAPVISEVAATQRAVAIAEATGAPIYIVHLSSQRALGVCAEAQAHGLPVYVETRPLYLHLTSERFEEEDAGKYVGQPPLREPSDVAALWAGLRQGTIHTVCSDHAPYALADKLDPAHTVAALRAGVENLQLLRPMLYSEGVRTGRISLARFVQLTASNAARLFGLERKGRIAPGYDADLVLFDPNVTRTVDNAMLKSKVDYSVYEGWEITGWPVMTISRGEIVFQDGEVVAEPGRGQIVRCSCPAML
jgi:dihydropyrimidinase